MLEVFSDLLLFVYLPIVIDVVKFVLISEALFAAAAVPKRFMPGHLRLNERILGGLHVNPLTHNHVGCCQMTKKIEKF